MQINFKQSQFELFPSDERKNKVPQKPKWMFTCVTLSIENIIVGVMAIILALILSFSLGVRNGRMVRLNYNLARNGNDYAKNFQRNDVIDSLKFKAVGTENKKLKINDNGEEVVDFSVQDVYTIQVASFRTKEAADLEKRKLEYLGYDSFILTLGKYFIVCVNKIEGKKSAKEFKEELIKKTKYKDSLIRRL